MGMGSGNVVPGSREGEFGLKGEVSCPSGQLGTGTGLTTPLTCDIMKRYLARWPIELIEKRGRDAVVRGSLLKLWSTRS